MMVPPNHEHSEKKNDEKKEKEEKKEVERKNEEKKEEKKLEEKREEQKEERKEAEAKEEEKEERKEAEKKEEKKEAEKKEEKKSEEKREEKKEEVKKPEEKTEAEKKAEERAEAIEKKTEAIEKKLEEKKPLKFLFVSFEGLIGDLAWQVKKEGHEVKYYIQAKPEKDVCDGFVEKCDDWKELKDWADIIVFDDIGFGEAAEKLRKEGKLVVGGSVYADKVELDRDFGQEEMKAAGMNILPKWNFTDFDEAIKFVTEKPDRYVIKPSGMAQNEKELLFVGQEEDGKDVLQVLQLYKKRWSKKIKVFQLQRYAAGVEVAVGAFFNGKEFVTPVCINFEHKRMFAGEIGPSTGEMGTLLYWSPPNTIYRETLEKMVPKLAESGYVGYFDINCIANVRGIYPLEITARWGYPTISIQMEGVTSPWGEFLYALAKGEKYELKTKRGFQVGVVIAVPPFPFHDPDAFRKYSEEAVIIFKKPSAEGVHPGDVKLIEEDWVLAGQSGYALIITGAGMTVEDARKQAYKRVENILIPNMFYRMDIGERWVRDSDLLHNWGYLY